MLVKVKQRLPDDQEDVVYRVIGCGIEVHRELGPGFKERVSRLKALHRSQVISYLRTTKLPVGLLMNFNSRRLKDSMDRIVV